MLTSLQRMIGMPVVWQDRQLGYVEQVFPDPAVRRLEGIAVRRGFAGAKWAPADKILLVGTTCVLLEDPPQRFCHRRTGQSGRAYLPTGECAGEVTDALMDGNTLMLRALEISRRPAARLLGRCLYAADYQTGSSDGGVMVNRLLTWPQLRRQLGEEDDE